MAKETEQAKHSPLPWVRGLIEHHSMGYTVEIESSGPKPKEVICTVECYEGDETHLNMILHCVNTHDKLVETLKNLVDISLRIGLEDSQPMRDEMAEAVVGAEAALADLSTD